MSEAPGSNGGAGTSGGMSKSGMIAIATALITAGTTIAVAYINRDDGPKAAPAPAPSPAPTGGPAPVQGYTPAAAPQQPVQPAPQQFVAAPPDISGRWRTPDNSEVLDVNQSGGQLALAAQGNTALGYMTGNGQGQINGRNVSFVLGMTVQGNPIEVECSGQLTSTGNSIQGTCTTFGKTMPMLYVR